MKLSRLLVCLFINLAVLQSACNPADELSFTTEQRYKHELYSTDDCNRISKSNAEFNCSETVQFNSDKTVDLLLGGGDIGVRSTYQRKGQKITVQPSPGLPKEIVFEIVNDNELSKVDNSTRWLKY